RHAPKQAAGQVGFGAVIAAHDPVEQGVRADRAHGDDTGQGVAALAMLVAGPAEGPLIGGGIGGGGGGAVHAEQTPALVEGGGIVVGAGERAYRVPAQPAQGGPSEPPPGAV